MPTPILDHDLGFDAIPEPLNRQTLVPEFSVEAFVRSVLPRLTRIDQRSLDALLDHPLQQCRADEFRTVVSAE